QGANTLTLSAANSYSGGTTIGAGKVILGNASALGTTAGNTVVSSGAVLDLNGLAVGAEPVTLNGTGINNLGALINGSLTAASLSVAITLGADSSVGGSGDTTLSGAITDGASTFGLTKVGSGTVT